ncbi:MAG: bifunctional UDP-N-acetylglucosamine diphosphorylase/glucosamine-1-phosphate N-acetyltransferase GlmU [Monoglobales bacterium]
MSSISSVILAAGSGVRMISGKAKVTHEVCFTPIIKLVYSAAQTAGIDNIITVIGNHADEVKKCLGEDKKYAFQEQQLGTGHAVMSAMSQLSDGDTLLVLSGDVPLVSPETLKSAIKYHLENRLAATVITATLDNPAGYGRILRDENLNVKAIIEDKDATVIQKQITEVNSGMYCFDIGLLRAALSDLRNDNSQSEFYLTDTIEILLENGYSVGAYSASDPFEIYGINDRGQLAMAEAALRNKINHRLMLSGVTLIDPSTTYIGTDVTIEPDCVIYPNTIIKGHSHISSGCIIGPSSMIDSSEIASGCEVLFSTVLSSKIGSDVHIGPFAYIRPGCSVGNSVKVGDFVELKNSNIGRGTKISHLTYVGDSDVGENVNFGCGTVTVNYDSKNKHRTTIGDNAFIGCNSNLVAPVNIARGAYTAAGSTITEDVPEDSLAVARARQVNKSGWVKKKKF